MLHKTKGIVFKTTNYGESSVVVQIFTKKYGLQSYLLNGVKKPKSKVKLNFLQPLFLLDLVVYHKAGGNIQRISDIRPAPLLADIPYDIIKSSVVIFLNEVLYKCVKQHTDDQHLFDYIFNAVALFDTITTGIANFHLVFLIKLTKFLGFYPDMSNADSCLYFNLIEGNFTKIQPLHRDIIDSNFINNWIALLRTSLTGPENLVLNNNERKYYLDKLLTYYSLHLDDFRQIKSHLILEEVLS